MHHYFAKYFFEVSALVLCYSRRVHFLFNIASQNVWNSIISIVFCHDRLTSLQEAVMNYPPSDQKWTFGMNKIWTPAPKYWWKLQVILVVQWLRWHSLEIKPYKRKYSTQLTGIEPVLPLFPYYLYYLYLYYLITCITFIIWGNTFKLSMLYHKAMAKVIRH